MNSKLINTTAAAYKLGITKELLFAYVRNPPKKHLGHDKKLKAFLEKDEYYFDVEELEKFDKYLKEPWCNSPSERPSIPKYIQEYLKVESGGKCPITGKGYPLENAHIIDFHQSLNHHHHNLIRINKDIHTGFDSGVSLKEKLQSVKNALVEKLRSELYSSIASKKATFTPPNPNPIFIGRTVELKNLLSALGKERVIIIQGVGGVGKTQLLLNALAQKSYTIPTLWLEAESFENLLDLEIAIANEIRKFQPYNNEASLIDNLKEVEVILVIDGIENLFKNNWDETDEFLQELVLRTNTPKIIVTSQIDLSTLALQNYSIKLKVLTPNDSKKIISKILETSDFNLNELEKIDPLIYFCGGHPFSLKLVSALLIFFRSIDITIKHLETQSDLLHPFSQKSKKSTSLEKCLSTIYNCLTPQQVRLIKYIGCFPIGVKILRIPPFLNNSDNDFDLARLRQFFLIEFRDDDLNFKRTYLLNPIHKFVKIQIDKELENKKEFLEIQREAIRNLMIESIVISNKYIETNEEGVSNYGLMRIECELYNLIEASEIAQRRIDDTENDELKKVEYQEILVGLAGALGKYFFTRGYLNLGKSFAQKGVEQSLKLGNIESAGLQYMYLAQIQQRQNDINGFEETVVSLNELAIETNNIEILINANWSSGRLLLIKNEYEAALSKFKHVRKLLEKRLREDIEDSLSINGNLALIISEIAKTHEFSGNYLEANKYYPQAIKLQKKLNDNINIVSNFHHYGMCLCSTGNLDLGIKYYNKAIEGFIQFRQFEYLGNTIAELGRLVERRPELSNHSLLDEKNLIFVLETLKSQYLEIVRQKINTGEKEIELERIIPFTLIGKGILIIQYLSFSSYSYLLFNWALNLAEDLKYQIQIARISSIGCIINIAHIVGTVGNGEYSIENKEAMLIHLKRNVLIINGKDLKSKTRLFYWLAKWLIFSCFEENSTAEGLINDAYSSLE